MATSKAIKYILLCSGWIKAADCSKICSVLPPVQADFSHKQPPEQAAQPLRLNPAANSSSCGWPTGSDFWIGQEIELPMNFDWFIRSKGFGILTAGNFGKHFCITAKLES